MSEVAAIDATTIKPKTFEDLRDMARELIICQRCGHNRATHTLSLTAGKIGLDKPKPGRRKAASIEAQIRATPVCESCGVELFAVVKKALRS